MRATLKLRFNSTNTIYLEGPMDKNTGALSSGGTCNALLFHDRKDTSLSADEASSQADLSVGDPSLYEPDVDTISIQKDDKTWFDCGLVTAIDKAAGTITITSPIDANISKGAAVRARFGSATPIAMTSYGSPVANTYDWGYRGTIAATHDINMRVGVPVRAEITLLDAGVQLVEPVTVPVTGGS